MTELVTFGYQTVRTPERLLELLDRGHVDRVVDVRLRAYSGIPMWSTGTASTIRATGREYVWAHQLGNLAYKTGGIAMKDESRLADLVLDPLRAGVTVALMCACWDQPNCHRTYLADRAAGLLQGLRVVHL